MTGKFPPAFRPQRQTRPSSRYGHEQHKCTSVDCTSVDLGDTITYQSSSLDLTQRLERKLAKYNASKNVFKRWSLELLSWITSALCMGAIVGIYLRIDGHTMAKNEMWLNTANILGKIASAALIVPTSEALGQLKWNWFHDSKAMWDFEIFDKASRGPWGAALLLYRTKGRSLAALGALLIVLLLAIDTFFQQVTTFPDRWSLDSTGSEIPRMVEYQPSYTPEYYAGYETNFLDQNFRPTALQYFTNNGTQPTPFGNGTRADIPLSCPANNCTWPVYETLGVCSRCEDVSNLLEYACLSTIIDWSTSYVGSIKKGIYPNSTACGYFLNATSTKPVLMSGYLVNSTEQGSEVGEILFSRTLPLTDMLYKTPLFGGSIQFRNIRSPITDALIASAANISDGAHQKSAPLLHECMLAWCVKTIRSTYDLGRYHEEVISTFINTTTTELWPWEHWEINAADEDMVMTIYNPDIAITPPSAMRDGFDDIIFNHTYRLSNHTASNALLVFDDYIPSSYTAASPLEKPMLRYRNFLDGPSLRKLDFNPLLAPNNITAYWERLATSITNAVRSDAHSREMMQGLAFNKSQFVSIRWEWLIFPFALLVLSLTFLVSTMIKTSEDSETIWKTSAIPTLIYSLPEESRSRLVGPNTWNSSHGATKKVRIKLLPKQGWRISGQTFLRSPRAVDRNNQPPPGWI